MNFFHSSRGKEQSSSGRRRLTGVQKGAILLALAVCILAVTLFLIYRAVVRPVERPAQITPAAAAQSEPVSAGEKEQTEEEPDQEQIALEVPLEVPVSYRPGVYHVLICGTDGDGLRTDTIIIAHLDVNTHETALLSIPRDTIVPRADGGIMKINSVYNGGKQDGMERLETRLAAMLGFEMDGYVLVDLEAFEKIVDLIGGVWFDVPQDMYYVDNSQDLTIDLKQGYQLLDGEKAMHLVRFRKGYASQDIQRTKVQQDFLKALAGQCMKISNLAKIQEFAEIISEYVITDLTVGNMLYYMQELLKCDLDAMQSYTAEGEGMMINGVSYYPLYANRLLSILNESFNPYDTEITQAQISLITPEAARSYQMPAEPEADDAEEIPAEQMPAEQTPVEEDTPPDTSLPEEPDIAEDWPDDWDGGWPDETDDALWEEP